MTAPGNLVVVITSTDTRTGSVERDVYEMTPAPAPGTEGQVLVQLVVGIHPDAIVEAIEGNEALLRDGHLTIHAALSDEAAPAGPAPSHDQGSLFDL